MKEHSRRDKVDKKYTTLTESTNNLGTQFSVLESEIYEAVQVKFGSMKK